MLRPKTALVAFAIAAAALGAARSAHADPLFFAGTRGALVWDLLADPAAADRPVESWAGLDAWAMEQRLRIEADPLVLELSEPSLFPSSWPSGDGSIGCTLMVAGGVGLADWDHEARVGAPWLGEVKNGHTDKEGRWIDYWQIPRRWDRPESYTAYRWPVPNGWVVSGYDLEKPDSEQRRGTMSAVGHGGVDLVEKKGTPIHMVGIDHQLGDAEVVYSGWLWGETVITRHRRREGGKTRDYVLVFAHLEKPGDDVWRGRRLRQGEIVGYVGDSASPELVHLHLEARRVKDGADAWRLGPAVVDREGSTVCDPRNVMPLRDAPRPRRACAPRLVPKRDPAWLAATTPLMLGVRPPE